LLKQSATSREDHRSPRLARKGQLRRSDKPLPVRTAWSLCGGDLGHAYFSVKNESGGNLGEAVWLSICN